MSPTREELLVRTFVELADTLVDDFDVVELLTLLVNRSLELLDAGAVGLILADDGGQLQLVASTSHSMELVELFALQSEEGPCLDCWRTGDAVLVDDLATANARWPRFVPYAIDAGFAATHAIPLRLRGDVLGALNLFRNEPGQLGRPDLSAARALSDIATIGILQARAVRDAKTVATQLQYALESRVAIEQAKGILAERGALDMDGAFVALRTHSRSHQRHLSEVAEDLVTGVLDPTSILQAGTRSVSESG